VDVFLLRHADAVEETLALPDSARYLSAAGRDQARALGDRLRWYDCLPVAVWTSPLVRAVQTAELVLAGLQLDAPVDVRAWRELAPAPTGDVHGIERAIGGLAAGAMVIVVGHEPGLSALGGVLVGRPDFPPLKKAEAVRIQDGAVRWRFAYDDDAPRAGGAG
jgi:phosphohistidine phosphatase